MRPAHAPITYREALREALAQAMEHDPRVFVYGLDVADHKGIFGSTKGLVDTFGSRRVFSTPLSEDALAGFGLGAALNGLRPVNVHIRVDFLLLAMNQLVNMMAIHHYMTGGALAAPIVIRAVIGRGWGQGAQHSKTLHAFFAHIPGLKVVMPTTPADAKGMLLAAIRDPNPVIVLEHRWLYDVAGIVDPSPDAIVPLGTPRVVREGSACTIIATSWMTIEAMKAANVLARRGISLEVIDARSISPFDDTEIVASVAKTRHAIVADLDWLHCGFSAEIAARISASCFGRLDAPVTRIGFAPAPCPTTRPLEDQFYPNAVAIIRAVESQLELSPTDLAGEEFYSYENKFTGPF